MKKIKFQTASADFDIPKPMPASRAVPEWYRKMDGTQEKVHSVKRCVPFLDALTAGYVITLPVDVEWDADLKQFKAPRSSVEVLSRHHDSQINGVDISAEYVPIPWKWINHWFIKTPKGYSCLFVHPLNRTDLPFYSLTGVVDTDKHPVITNFPFVVKEGFSGVIPAGTPLIQVIPFKRDDWEADIDDAHSYYYPKSYEVEMPPYAWYKRKWWSRKRYS